MTGDQGGDTRLLVGGKNRENRVAQKKKNWSQGALLVGEKGAGLNAIETRARKGVRVFREYSRGATREGGRMEIEPEKARGDQNLKTTR